VVACSFLIELTAVGGRAKLDAPVHSLIAFED
jgi:hypothetical protein